MTEESIKDIIAAMEGWAIKAKQKIASKNFNEAVKLLRNLNTQGRRLEWSGSKSGLKHLPKLKEVGILKQKISQSRAAAQESLSALQHLDKLAKKEGKKPAEVAVIEKKRSDYLKTAGQNVVMCIQLLKESRGIVESEPWFDGEVLSRPENKEILLMLLCGQDFYESTRPNTSIIQKINLKMANFTRANLKEADLEGADLEGADLTRADLTGANLKGANFTRANFSWADLIGANLFGANLTRAYLIEANLFGANLTRANLREAILTRADLREAILTGANLIGADLTRANFTTAYLIEANLIGANLFGANLTRANLSGANLSGANFTETIVTAEQLKKALK